MTLGPLMVDVRGAELSVEERELLQHPLIGGVILFTRNYVDRPQLTRLVDEIHGLRSPPLLVAVDHEGGRVQRFREGFSKLPACARYGELYEQHRREALQMAEDGGWLMAAELRAAGIDFSFAPVLDLHTSVSSVIGDRAFHREPEAVASLAFAYMKGMHAAGMAAVGKHFPGHGSVAADSHLETPIDGRDPAAISAADLVPFARLVRNGIDAIMPAHVIYPQADPQAAGFSRYWLEEILRGQLDFAGVIFSDDVNMSGATVAGDIIERAMAACDAGCDMVLACNDPASVVTLIQELDLEPRPASRARLMRMHGRAQETWEELLASDRWQRISRQVVALEPAPELDLNDEQTG